MLTEHDVDRTQISEHTHIKIKKDAILTKMLQGKQLTLY